jgi:hypothetical protein
MKRSAFTQLKLDYWPRSCLQETLTTILEGYGMKDIRGIINVSGEVYRLMKLNIRHQQKRRITENQLLTLQEAPDF